MMTREQVLDLLRKHKPELEAEGIVSASLFGSVARGEPYPGDVDIAVRLSSTFPGGFDYFGKLDELEARLRILLDTEVDVVEEPVRRKKCRPKLTGTASLPSERARGC